MTEMQSPSFFPLYHDDMISKVCLDWGVCIVWLINCAGWQSKGCLLKWPYLISKTILQVIFLCKEGPMKRKEKIHRMILLFVIKLFYVSLRGCIRLRGYILKFLPWIPWSSIPDLPDKLTEMAIIMLSNKQYNTNTNKTVLNKGEVLIKVFKYFLAKDVRITIY